MTARLILRHQYRQGPNQWHWAYRVVDDHGRTMASDGTCGGAKLLTQGLRDLAAFHRLERMGHTIETLPSYTELCSKDDTGL